jgi:hypothetical protein
MLSGPLLPLPKSCRKTPHPAITVCCLVKSQPVSVEPKIKIPAINGRRCMGPDQKRHATYCAVNPGHELYLGMVSSCSSLLVPMEISVFLLLEIKMMSLQSYQMSRAASLTL